jgi:hypothetical protein
MALRQQPALTTGRNVASVRPSAGSPILSEAERFSHTHNLHSQIARSALFVTLRIMCSHCLEKSVAQNYPAVWRGLQWLRADYRSPRLR